MTWHDQLHENFQKMISEAPSPEHHFLMLKLRIWPSFEQREIYEIWVQPSSRSYVGRLWLWDWEQDQKIAEDWQLHATQIERLRDRYHPREWLPTLSKTEVPLSPHLMKQLLNQLSNGAFSFKSQFNSVMIDGTSCELFLDDFESRFDFYWNQESQAVLDELSLQIQHLFHESFKNVEPSQQAD